MITKFLEVLNLVVVAVEVLNLVVVTEMAEAYEIVSPIYNQTSGRVISLPMAIMYGLEHLHHRCMFLLFQLL